MNYTREFKRKTKPHVRKFKISESPSSFNNELLRNLTNKSQQLQSIQLDNIPQDKQTKEAQTFQTEQPALDNCRNFNETIKLSKTSNIFLSSLSPKKISNDSRLLRQIYKKKARNLLINRNFHNSYLSINVHSSEDINRGFKGSKLQNTATNFRKNKFEESERSEQDIDFPLHNSKTQQYFSKNKSQRQKIKSIPHSLSQEPMKNNTKLIYPRKPQKPNMMYNLTLYRKKFRSRMVTEERNEAQEICCDKIHSQKTQGSFSYSLDQLKHRKSQKYFKTKNKKFEESLKTLDDVRCKDNEHQH